MKIVAVEEAQTKLDHLVSETAASHVPIQIQGDDATAVLIAEDDWRSIEETLFLLSIPGMRESIREGLATPIEECSDEPGW